MADRDGERDRRVRELMNNNKKDNFAVLGQAQAEVSDIQSELRNHLAMQQAQDQSRLQQAQTISQAAGGMMAMENGQNLQGQVATMNPQTQAAMSKFGVKPQRRQTQTNTQNSARTVTKAGDVTNIKNEYTTNNKTEIRVTQPSIPIAQPAIQVSQPQRKTEDSTAKFKAWLSGMFAKQQNDAEIQRKEYRKKEWNLGRTTTRLMKRIGEATSNLGSKLDPKNMTSTLGGQLKWLLLIFGATMMAKFWKPTMEFLANLEGGFKAVFGLPMNEDLKSSSHRALSIIDQIKDFIGIKRGEDTTLIGGIGRVFSEGIQKLIDKLKFWFEDRALALKDIEFPQIEMPNFGALGKVFSPMMEGLTNTFQSVAQYLGDIITVAMGGSKGRVKVAAKKVAKQAKDVFTNTEGKELSARDSGFINGKGRDYMRDSDYDMSGDLKGNASSTHAMSRSLLSMFKDKSNKAHTTEISTGVGQLFNTAKRKGQVVIDPELLDYLGLSQNDKYSLMRNGQLKQEDYRLIKVNAEREDAKELKWVYDKNYGEKTTEGIGKAAGYIGGQATAHAIGGPIGSIIGGHKLGKLYSKIAGDISSGIGKGLDIFTQNETLKGKTTYKLVKADSGEVGIDGSAGIPKKMWVLTREGADFVTSKFTADMSNKEMDLSNKEFYDKLRNIEERKKRQNGVKGALTQNLQTKEVNDMREKQAAYEASERSYYNKFESRDPNSENMQKYGHLNTTMDNIGNFISSGISYISTGLRNGGNFVLQERLGTAEQAKRQAYVISRLMKEGLTREQAAGIAGNIMKESGFVANKKVMDNNHKYAGGIVGWNGPNLERVERYFGKDIRQVPFEDQVEYLIKELKGEVNGMKAIDRDGYASRFGFRSGSNVFDIMKRTRGIEEATVTFERVFEGSGDYKGYKDKNGIRRGGDGNKRRIEYALGAHKSSLSYGDVSDYKSTPPPQINLKELQDEKVKRKEIVGAGWLGDSQSCACGGLFPRLVGEGLGGCVFRFYARGSANGAHYTGENKNTKNLSDPTTNIPGFNSGSTCVEAKDWMITNKPKYCFLALGHNGMKGYQTLAHMLMGAGIKVIGIKMWSTNAAPGTGMRSYSKEEMSKMYDGINLDGFVDLSQLDVPKVKDGVHASKEGCAIAAREVIQQLSGQTPTVGSENGSEDYLKTQDGIFGGFSEMVSTAMNKAADLLEGEKEDDRTLLEKITENLNPEQKKIVTDSLSRMTQTEAINTLSWQDSGAKTDLKGTYFKVGNYKAYVRTDGVHNGLFGLKKDDIDWIEKIGEDGKPAEMSDDEYELATKAVSYSVDSLFSDYPEKTKGNGYDDYMKDSKGGAMGFYIGKFEDIGSFKDPAPDDFGGSIKFWIYPTKDIKSWTMVGIGKKVKCSLEIISSDRGGIRYYGPIIYHKGAHWLRPSASPSRSSRKEEDYIDEQPICYYLNVRLTPSATMEAYKLLEFMNNTEVKNGRLQKRDGTSLTKSEVNLAEKYGIIDGKDNILLKSEYGSEIEKSKKLNIKEFNLDKYSEKLKIKNTKEDREKYYNEHKELFKTIDGTIYGPSGLKWGTVDKDGKINFYDNKTMSDITTKEGQEGLEKNFKKIEESDTTEMAKAMGLVSRDTMANFLAGTMDYKKKSLNKRKSQLMSGIRDQFVIKYKQKSVPIKYYSYYDDEGNLKKVAMYKRDFISEMKKKVGGTYGDWGEENLKNLPEKIEAKSHSELFKLVNNLLKVGSKNSSFKEGVYLGTDQPWRKGFDEDRKKLISKGEKIVKLKGNKAYLENGEILELSQEYPVNYSDKLIKDINAQIELRNKQLMEQETDKSFEESGLKQIYEDFTEKANKGELNYTQAFGNYVTTSGGDIFGIKGEDGKITSLDASGARKAALEYFNQAGVRESFYQRMLKTTKDSKNNNYYNVKGKNGKTFRIKVDQNKDINDFLKKGLSGISYGSAQVFRDGKWVDTKGEENQEALSVLNGAVTQLTSQSGFTNDLISALKEMLGNRLNDAAKSRIKQLNIATDQKTQQKQMNIYLKQIAEKGLDEDDLEHFQQEIRNSITQGETEKRGNTSFTKYADDQIAKGVDISNYKVVGDNHHQYAIDTTKVTKITDKNSNGKLDAEDLKGLNIKAGKHWSDKGKEESVKIINYGGNYYVINSDNSITGLNATDKNLDGYASSSIQQ